MKNTSMKNKLLIIFFLKLTLMMSQTGKDNYFPPAPEANSLIKYVDVPVNYSTGATNYSIPIHTIKLKNLNIPITLNYQSSGLKPSEIASNTGLGWELNAGGKITQNVVNQNDLDVPGPANPVWNLPNDREFKLPQPVSDLSFGQSPYSHTQLDSIHAAGTDYTLFYDIDQLNLNTKPDIFYYSTPNKSGKFFFGNNFETKQIPFGKEKIIYNPTTRNFEITDVDGVRYLYSTKTENVNSTESVCQNFPKLNGTSNSNSYNYYLTQIITPNNETVDFIYDTVTYYLANDKDYTRYYHWFYGGGEKVTSYYSQITTKVLTKIKVNQDYEIEFLYNNYRKDIKGTVQSTAPKTLDIINIKYKNVIETYNFNYGYFDVPENTYNPSLFESATINENSEYRLKLKSFQKSGENSYVFSYYNEAAIERYTTCLDHWGYYNESCGRYVVNNLFNDLGSTKAPNLEKSKTNVLKSVMLPTTGQVEFNYELNTCSDCSVSYPSYYWIPFTAYANPDDNFSNEFISNTTVFTVPNNITVPYIKFNLYSPGEATTTNYATAELYDDQNHLMNFEVTGTTGDNFKPYNGDQLVTGKTYRLVLKCYDTMENENKYITINFLGSTDIITPIPSVGGLRIANIKTKDFNNYITNRAFDYNDNGLSSGILYEKPFYFDEYSYFSDTTDPEANQMQYGLISYAVQNSRISSDLFGFNGYHIFYKKVTEKNTDVNNPNNVIKVEKYFTFNDDIRYGEQAQFSKVSYNWKRGLPLQINEFNNNDIIRKTMFSYRFLDTPPGTKTSSNEPGFPLMNASFPNEFQKRSIDINVFRRSSNFYNIYLYSSYKLISAWYYMDKKTTEEYFNGNVLKTEENFKYDNPVHAQLTSQSTTNSKGETTETKYTYPDDIAGESLMSELIAANRIGTPIITEQYNAGILFSKNRTAFAKDATTSNLIVPKSLYAAKFPNILPTILNIGNLEKKITYDQYDDKGNVLQYTPEGGTNVSIIWGYNKTWPIAKIEKAAYSEVSAYVANIQNLSDTGTEVNLIDALNALRTALPNAMITTYTYQPLIGVSTITDPKQYKITYTYDAFGRLQFVKDAQGNLLSENQYHYKNQ
jgi:YD repeat-containing protein